MAKAHIGVKNSIESCSQLANISNITNIPINHANDARNTVIDFEKKSKLSELVTRDSGCFRPCKRSNWLLGRSEKLLKVLEQLEFISKFKNGPTLFVTFLNFVWCFHNCKTLFFALYTSNIYLGMNQGYKLGLNLCNYEIFDLIFMLHINLLF